MNQLNKIVDIILVWIIFYYILKSIRNNVKLTLIFKGVAIIAIPAPSQPPSSPQIIKAMAFPIILPLGAPVSKSLSNFLPTILQTSEKAKNGVILTLKDVDCNDTILLVNAQATANLYQFALRSLKFV